MNPSVPVDPEKLQQFMGRVLGDLGSAMHSALSYIGDRLGIFRAMAEAGPVTAADLAERTGLSERYLEEWLGGMAAGEYVVYEPGTRTFRLPPEHAAILANEEGPFFMGGFFHMVPPTLAVAPRVAEAFRTGKGVAQDEYPTELAEAFERVTAPTFRYQLVHSWIAALPELKARLEAGASVLDVGCGGGRACLAIAQAFPRARVRGLDRYAPAIERARANARAAGLEERLSFDVADGAQLPRNEFELITVLDVLHDAADPLALLTAIRNALTPDGTCLVQEINAEPQVEKNISPLGKFLYSGSTMYCLSVSLADHGPGFGSLMGRERLFELARKAGFSDVRALQVDNPLFAVSVLRR